MSIGSEQQCGLWLRVESSRKKNFIRSKESDDEILTKTDQQHGWKELGSYTNVTSVGTTIVGESKSGTILGKSKLEGDNNGKSNGERERIDSKGDKRRIDRI